MATNGQTTTLAKTTTVSSLGQLLPLPPTAGPMPASLQTTNADERAQTLETVLWALVFFLPFLI
jgi:hypothetical protein